MAATKYTQKFNYIVHQELFIDYRLVYKVQYKCLKNMREKLQLVDNHKCSPYKNMRSLGPLININDSQCCSEGEEC